MKSVPVQFDMMPTSRSCETGAEAHLPHWVHSPRASVGTPKQRKALAVAATLKALTKACEERLPWGVPPHHCDRGTPRGVSLFAEDVHGKLPELSVNAKGKLETVAGGCVFTAKVIVVWHAKDYEKAATEFKADLVKRGYKHARTAPPSYVKKAEAKGAKS